MFDDFDYDGIASFDGLEDLDEPLDTVGDNFVSHGNVQSGIFGNQSDVFSGNIFGGNSMVNQDVFETNNMFGEMEASVTGFPDATVPNIFGGQDIIEDGVRTGFTQPNIFGGANLVEDGMVTTSTIPNIFGGQDIIEDGVRVVSTQPNIFGGQDVFANGARIGNTIPNIFGKK